MCLYSIIQKKYIEYTRKRPLFFKKSLNICTFQEKLLDILNNSASKFKFGPIFGQNYNRENYTITNYIMEKCELAE